MVDQPELRIPHVVVDRLGNARGRQLDAPVSSQTRDPVSRVHGVVAADVEEVAHVVSPHHLDDAFEILSLGVGELVAAGSHCPGRGGGAQEPELPRILPPHVDELLQQDPLHPVPGGVHPVYMVREIPAALQHAEEG